MDEDMRSVSSLLAVAGARLDRRLLLVLLLIWFGLGNSFSATASSFEALVALCFKTAIIMAHISGSRCSWRPA